MYGAKTAAALRAAGHEIVDLSDPTRPRPRQAREALDAYRIDVLTVVGGDGMVHLGANLCLAARSRSPSSRPAPATTTPGSWACRSVTPSPRPRWSPPAGQRAVDLGRCVTSAGETRWWIRVLGGGFDSVVT